MSPLVRLGNCLGRCPATEANGGTDAISLPTGKWTCPTCAHNVFAASSIPTSLPPRNRRPRDAVSPELTLESSNNTHESVPRERDKSKGKARALDLDNFEPTDVKLTLKLGASDRPAERPTPTRQRSRRPRDSDAGGRERHEIPYHILQQQQREAEEAAEEAEEDDEDEGEEEEDLFDGILGEEARDYGDRRPEREDRKRWEESKSIVEVSITVLYQNLPGKLMGS